MIGIVSYGSYVPFRRLKRAAIAQTLGIPAGKGERAVASFDEDSVSMAVEAARDALRAAPDAAIGTLLFATTTPPYAEKLNAAIVGAAARLPLEIRAADLTGSVRAGLSALLQAADAARGGTPALVAMGDCRLAAPEGKSEQTGGDGAAAFVVGSEGVIAEIEATASLTREYLDTWRAQGERFAHGWEERFTLTQAHAPLLGKVIQNVLAQANVAPSALAKVVLDAPNPRSVGRLIESKGDVAYASYLKWREILPTEPPRRPDPARPAGPPMLRSQAWKFGFVGSRCTACGTPQLPPQRVCVHCQARDRMEPYSFADRRAKIATFTLDRLAISLNPPTVNVVVDYEGGGRFLCEMTDCEPEKVAIGDEVEMTFRRMYTAGGVHNYFWKVRPKR